MSKRRNVNVLGLSLPPTVNENETAEQSDNVASSATPSLDEQIRRFGLSELQRQRLHEWITEKEGVQLELNEEMLERICDLGHGNGGIVSKELRILNSCNSPYIVGFYGAFVVENDISICMEYMDGLSLDIVMKKMGRLPESIVGLTAVAVVRGLTYLEEIKVLHRDVKPSNMLVSSRGEIKLCDFGVSRCLIDSMASSFVGTCSYMAPERLIGASYTALSDVWSFGLSLVELAIGRYPSPTPTRGDYAAMFGVPIERVLLDDAGDASAAPSSASTPISPYEMFSCIVDEKPPALPRGVFSDELVDFVGRCCLRKNPGERSNLGTLAAHPFYKRYEHEDQTAMADFVRKSIDRQLAAAPPPVD